MAHPKRKISRTRRDKRRTHDALTAPSLAKCPTTGVAHPLHQAYAHQGALYYRGQVLIKAPTQDATT